MLIRLGPPRGTRRFFDTELLLLAEHNGLRIHEVPVDWVEDVDTRVDVLNTARDDLRGLWRMARLKASGGARVDVRPRPAPAAEHPDAVLAPSARRGALSWEVGCFLAIGVVSTVGQAPLYWLLRGWWSPAVANLVSLLALTVLNTEANRRLTFRHSTAPPARVHLGAGGLFVIGYLVTSGAVLWFKWIDPGASAAAETAVLVTASVAVTCVRFAVLRLAVFNSAPGRTRYRGGFPHETGACRRDVHGSGPHEWRPGEGRAHGRSAHVCSAHGGERPCLKHTCLKHTWVQRIWAKATWIGSTWIGALWIGATWTREG
ncbi:GtrA family protein [Streptomyces sp. NPDC057623]|uniref:GtrA family protein n=1 Tax=Streptomyces sp. NPDC057623 TaxID=3346187 RepID=UPI0036C1E66D